MAQTAQSPSLPVEASHQDEARSWSRVFNDPRIPTLTFVAVEVVALVRVLALAPNKWFSYDEWEFLSGRTGGSLHSLLRPTIGHWMTLNILVFRGLYQIFGLRTYVPYEAVLVALHLTAAALLFVVIRRLSVFPWIATVAASAFVLFGSGWQDIIWAFQIGFVGSLVLGLAQLLLADHDAGISRRDWLGLLAGAAALMFSGVGVIMVMVVGIAVLVRRGWRPALFQTVPLAALYLAWWFGYARSYSPSLGTGTDLSTLAHWWWIGIRSSFDAMGQLTGVGVVLAVVLVVGLVFAWVVGDRSGLRRRIAVPAALLIGAFLFLLAAGWQRQQFNEFKLSHAGQSQYLYIFAAMALPALAVAIDALARRWRPLAVIALVPLLVGIPGNYQAFATGPDGLYQTAAESSYRQTMVALANVPVANQVPRSTRIGDLASLFRPEPAPLDVTLGWLLDQKAAGKLPEVGQLDPVAQADATLALALRQSQSATNSLNTGTTSASGQSSQSASAAPGGGVPLVSAANNPKYGPLLVDRYGLTLYTLTVGATPIPCAAGCAGTWRPLLAPSRGVAPTGGPSVSGLGTSASGTVVTYYGYPLFVYSGDKRPGETGGDGKRSAGGTWHPIRVQAPRTCNSLTAPTTKVLQKGQSLTFTGALGVIYLSGKTQSDETIFQPTYGEALSALAGPLTLQLLPIGGTTSVCI